MTPHYPDLGSASDWLNQISHAAQPIRSTTQIWVMECHQYGISVLVSQTSFGAETSGSIAIHWMSIFVCHFLAKAQGLRPWAAHTYLKFMGVPSTPPLGLKVSIIVSRVGNYKKHMSNVKFCYLPVKQINILLNMLIVRRLILLRWRNNMFTWDLKKIKIKRWFLTFHTWQEIHSRRQFMEIPFS